MCPVWVSVEHTEVSELSEFRYTWPLQEEFWKVSQQPQAAGIMEPTTSSTTTFNQSDDFLQEEPKKYCNSVRVAALTVGIPIVILGFLGNLMTIVSVIKTKALRTGANVFIISLSVFDMTYATIILPSVLKVIWNNGWVLGEVYCSIYPVILLLTTGGNLLSLSGTAFNRYLKIIHPGISSLVFGRRRNTAILACSFLSVPVLIVLPPVTGVWGKLGYEPITITCTFVRDNSGYTTFLMIFAMIIPIAFISFCYLRILCKVCANRRKVQAARSGDAQPASMREDLHYTKMMVSIFIMYLVTSTPYCINNLIDPSAEHMTMRFFTMVCFWLGSCANPILYGLLNRNFRHAFLNIYK